MPYIDMPFSSISPFSLFIIIFIDAAVSLFDAAFDARFSILASVSTSLMPFHYVDIFSVCRCSFDILIACHFRHWYWLFYFFEFESFILRCIDFRCHCYFTSFLSRDVRRRLPLILSSFRPYWERFHVISLFSMLSLFADASPSLLLLCLFSADCRWFHCCSLIYWFRWGFPLSACSLFIFADSFVFADAGFISYFSLLSLRFSAIFSPCLRLTYPILRFSFRHALIFSFHWLFSAYFWLPYCRHFRFRWLLSCRHAWYWLSCFRCFSPTPACIIFRCFFLYWCHSFSPCFFSSCWCWFRRYCCHYVSCCFHYWGFAVFYWMFLLRQFSLLRHVASLLVATLPSLLRRCWRLSIRLGCHCRRWPISLLIFHWLLFHAAFAAAFSPIFSFISCFRHFRFADIFAASRLIFMPFTFIRWYFLPVCCFRFRQATPLRHYFFLQFSLSLLITSSYHAIAFAIIAIFAAHCYWYVVVATFCW